jgi:Ca-activated chloride channel family protein
MPSQLRFTIGILVVLVASSPNAFAQSSSASNQDGTPVISTATVTDRTGNYVMGLTADSFQITDEKAVRQISLFQNVDEPMSIAILVDTSDSMQQPNEREIGAPKAIADAIWKFIEMGHQDNEYLLASFGLSFHLLADWSSGKALLANKPAITPYPEKKGTALYDACLTVLDGLSKGRHQKRVLLLFSDGLDEGSTNKYSDLARVLSNSDVLFYAIGPRMIFDTRFLNLQLNLQINFTAGEEVLADLTSLTGGAALVPENKKQFEAAIDRVSTELRHQYRIGFVTPAGTPNKWHQLKWKVRPPKNAAQQFSKLKVRGRQGYYPK